MYLKIVAVALGIFLLSCVAFPNPNPDTDNIPIEQSETYKWLTETPEGQELMRRANESGAPEQFLKDYVRWTNEGETHEQALQGWRGFPRRIARDIQEIPSELKTLRRDPWGGIVEHTMEYAFTTRVFDGLYKIVRGQFDLTDIFGALFIPCVVTFVLTKRERLRSAMAIIWFVDLIIDPRFWLHHIAATTILAGLTLLVRWAIQRIKEASANR